MTDEIPLVLITPYGCECDRCENGAMGMYQMWTCRYTGRLFKRIELELEDEDGDLYAEFSWMEVVQGGED
tara:strand:- start:157 stop:366 length:210 start_codon:yes stop_codon:yes gene_type:complete